MVELTLVIPTFNEDKHIEQTMHRLYKNLRSLKLNPEIILIDDSKDKTHDIIKKLEKSYKTLKVIHRNNVKGVGSAIRLGIDNAKGKYVIIFMSDAPNDTQYFPAILKKLREGYDLVQTSRFLGNSRMIRYPLKKRVASWLCNNFIKVVFLEFKLKDFSSLFKGFNKKRIKALDLESNEFDIGLEIVLKAMRKKYKIVEVPVDWVEREQGESKLKLSKFAKHYFNRIMKVWVDY